MNAIKILALTSIAFAIGRASKNKFKNTELVDLKIENYKGNTFLSLTNFKKPEKSVSGKIEEGNYLHCSFVVVENCHHTISQI